MTTTTTYIPKQDLITGTNLSGSDGDKNRAFTLTNDNAIAIGMQFIIDQAILQAGVDFTFNSTTNAVTFLNKVWDDQDIALDYFVTDSATVLTDAYCSTLQIARASGIGVEVFTENLGTGDASTKSFDLKNGNVLASSYTVYYGVADSNSFSLMTESSHYTINKDRGLIELTTAGLTLLSTKVLYIDYVYSPRHSNTVLATYLASIVAEVDRITGNYWGTPVTAYQYFDGYTSGYPQTDRPYGEQIEAYPELDLKYKGINSITSIITIDRDGNTDRTLDSTEYRLATEDQDNDYQDSRLLVNTTLPNGKANIKVTFVHGYATVPILIQELASYVGGMMALVNISGGSYKDVSTYTLGRKTFSIGQIYVNVRESIDQMNSRINSITNTMGGNFDCA